MALCAQENEAANKKNVIPISYMCIPNRSTF